jgi:hypothetical protein
VNLHKDRHRKPVKWLTHWSQIGKEFGKSIHTLDFRGQLNSRSTVGAYVNITHRTELGNLVWLLKEEESSL